VALYELGFVMTKVIFAPLKAVGRASVKEKRVKGADGKLRTLLTIDANSPTFDSDLTYVFKKNVARARQQNSKIAKPAPRAAKKSRAAKI